MKDYYRILQIHQEASPEIIERAYKTLARKYHPDSLPPEQREWATAKMQEINEARDILGDPKRRAEYMRFRKSMHWKVFWEEGLAGLYRRYMKS